MLRRNVFQINVVQFQPPGYRRIDFIFQVTRYGIFPAATLQSFAQILQNGGFGCLGTGLVVFKVAIQPDVTDSSVEFINQESGFAHFVPDCDGFGKDIFCPGIFLLRLVLQNIAQLSIVAVINFIGITFNQGFEDGDQALYFSGCFL